MGKVFKIVGGLLALVLVVGVVGWMSQRKADRPFAELEKTYGTAADHYVDLPGGYHVRYRDQGDPKAPVVVLLHGYYYSLDTWTAWAGDLSKSYRVVTLDLPGHGLTRAPAGWPNGAESYVALVEAFAKARGLDRFAIGGNSMGGRVAWAYTLAHPERVKGLILIDAAGWPQPMPAGMEQLKSMENPAVRFVFRDLDRRQVAVDLLRRAYANPEMATPALIDRYVAYGRAPGHRDALIDLALGKGDPEEATAAKLAAIKVPTLILHGDKDVVVPLSSSRKFAAAIPGSKLLVYPGVGHLPHEEAAAATVVDVAAFLASLEPKKPAAVKAAPSTRTAMERRDPNAVIFY